MDNPIRSSFGLAATILAFLLVLAPVHAETTVDKSSEAMANALIDMLRWPHIERTRPLYVSSAAWQAHCDAFQGEEWKAKCEEKRLDALSGETKVAALVKKFQLTEDIRKHGRLVFFIRIGIADNPTPLEEAWIDAIGDLVTGYFPPGESSRCAQDYPCTLIFRFDRESLKLMDVEFLALKS